MDQDNVVLGKVINMEAPAVTQHQGIDLHGIKEWLADTKNMNAEELSCGVQWLEPQILELIDHVKADGLLDRVAEARKRMAEQDGESVLPALP